MQFSSSIIIFAVAQINAGASDVGASYRIHENFNVVEGTDAHGLNTADIHGCQAHEGDIRTDKKAQIDCLLECHDTEGCVAVTFHPEGSMLKNKADGYLIERNDFVTKVLPNAKKCRFHDDNTMFYPFNQWCVDTCGWQLDNGFFAGKGDSVGVLGTCCWGSADGKTNCADETFAGLFSYSCYCDDHDGSTTPAPTELEHHSMIDEEQDALEHHSMIDEELEHHSMTHESSGKVDEDSADDESVLEDRDPLQSSKAGAHFTLLPNINIVDGTDADNNADIGGCLKYPHQDITKDEEKKQECLDECRDNKDCIAVTFHPMGSMLKKKIKGFAVSRNGYETMVLPSAKNCRFHGSNNSMIKPLNDWCVDHCSYALEHGFLDHKGDSTAFGTCCWGDDCEHTRFAGIFKYACFCPDDDDTPTTTPAYPVDEASTPAPTYI